MMITIIVITGGREVFNCNIGWLAGEGGESTRRGAQVALVTAADIIAQL